MNPKHFYVSEECDCEDLLSCYCAFTIRVDKLTSDLYPNLLDKLVNALHDVGLRVQKLDDDIILIEHNDPEKIKQLVLADVTEFEKKHITKIQKLDPVSNMYLSVQNMINTLHGVCYQNVYQELKNSIDTACRALEVLL